ncbi:MAG: uncharacterized protein KVP18_004100 [Porospora cf. gigantea A]|uniref:uncharacterized protein n=1 Tax=Porospora cf. gigantea A TaxID=2853593 RepID=UPI00355A8718|nr:MAG: hypothetical protein KVP18_004100 [Porospora cf. gigantea A]
MNDGQQWSKSKSLKSAETLRINTHTIFHTSLTIIRPSFLVNAANCDACSVQGGKMSSQRSAATSAGSARSGGQSEKV